MSMFYLDSRNIVVDEVASRDTGIRPTTRVIRRLGVEINFNNVLIGDLILFSPIEDGATSLAVRNYQRERYREEHSQWSHAAVYVGDGYMCHATLDTGVAVSEVSERILSDRIRFRRPKHQREVDRCRIAIAAMRRVGEKYHVAGIISRVGKIFHARETRGLGNEKAMKHLQICSGLYINSYELVKGSTCLNDSKLDHCPSDLSVSDYFDDVYVGWLGLKKA